VAEVDRGRIATMFATNTDLKILVGLSPALDTDLDQTTCTFLI
jgi:hypothetical protein